METKVKIGLRLAEVREGSGLSLREVCERIPGLEITTLHSYERGARMLPIDTARKLSSVYGVSAAYLLTLIEDMGEDVLLRMYRSTDDRGKATIKRIAESELPHEGGSEAA